MKKIYKKLLAGCVSLIGVAVILPPLIFILAKLALYIHDRNTLYYFEESDTYIKVVHWDARVYFSRDSTFSLSNATDYVEFKKLPLPWLYTYFVFNPNHDSIYLAEDLSQQIAVINQVNYKIAIASPNNIDYWNYEQILQHNYFAFHLGEDWFGVWYAKDGEIIEKKPEER